MKTLTEAISEIEDQLRAAQVEINGAGDMASVLKAQLLPLQNKLAALRELRRGRFEGEQVQFEIDGVTHVSKCYRTIGDGDDSISVVSVDGVSIVVPTGDLRSWRRDERA